MENLNKEKIFELLYKNKDYILNCGTKKLGLFGSYVRNEQHKKSDIDLLIEFEPNKKNYDNFINLAYYIEDLFNTKVELVTTESLNPNIKKYIDKEVEYVNFFN
ncbi:MAG: nucleotidyltransferase family protein [Candidatus Sericytochromatia bacterium]